MTGNEQVYKQELKRTDMSNLPVNILYPADYPERPAIMLPEWVGPATALEALDRIAPPSSNAAESVVADNN